MLAAQGHAYRVIRRAARFAVAPAICRTPLRATSFVASRHELCHAASRAPPRPSSAARRAVSSAVCRAPRRAHRTVRLHVMMGELTEVRELEGQALLR
jgi:hypothetical protein